MVLSPPLYLPTRVDSYSFGSPTRWLAMFQESDSERQEKSLKNNPAQNAPTATAAVEHASGATLLPRPIAGLISFLTHSTSLSLRIGTLFGGAAIDGARATTLTGLELSRAVIEGVLTRAGRDVAIRTSGERGKAEAESLLKRSVSYLIFKCRSHRSHIYACSVGVFAFNPHISILLRGSNVPSIIDNTLVGFAFIPGSTIHSRRRSWLLRVVQGNRRNRDAYPTGISQVGTGRWS